MNKFLRRNGRLILLLALFALFCLAIEHYIVHAVQVNGSSMVDTLRDGDIVLVTRLDYRLGKKPSRGERVIGLPGEQVEIRDSRLYIDGVVLSEPYATGSSEDYQVQLGVDEYLVLGDNRSESYDSRASDMGLLHSENFLGRVRMILWPLRKLN